MFGKRSYGVIAVGILLVMTLFLLLFGSRLFTDIEEEAHITQENRIVVGVSQLGSESGGGRLTRNPCRTPLHNRTGIF